MSEAQYAEVGKIVFSHQRMQMHLASFVGWMSGTATAASIAHSEQSDAYSKIGERFFAGHAELAHMYPRFLRVLADLNAMQAFIDGIVQHRATDQHLSDASALSAAISQALADLFDATAYPNAPSVESLKR